MSSKHNPYFDAPVTAATPDSPTPHITPEAIAAHLRTHSISRAIDDEVSKLRKKISDLEDASANLRDAISTTIGINQYDAELVALRALFAAQNPTR